MSDAKKNPHPLLQGLAGLVLYGALLVCISLAYLIFAEDIALFIRFVYRLVAVGALVLILWISLRLVFRKRFPRGWGIRITALCLGLVSLFLLLTGSLAGIARLVKPEDGFTVSTPFFSGKNVMVFAPHQDDELNLAGGVLEQYVAAGSQVSVVFSTNGDCYNPAEVRMQEALSAMALLGIPEENVYFLGFGDSWQSQTQDGIPVSHIYNSTVPDALWTSASGNTHCYGLHAAESTLGLEYTRDNYLLAIQSLISRKQPDVIYCVDHDSHADHKALDLFFEEALGNVLAELPDYHPRVFKGFCYSTAWGAEDDFASTANLQSTKKPEDALWQTSGIAYDWDARLRIPVSGDNLSRILTQTTVYRALQKHFSQNAYYHSGRILNTDKVFWERPTDSLLYTAVMLADGTPVNNLNDFKLRDSSNLSENRFPDDSACAASLIQVELAQPEYMDCIVLYDHPDPESNILSGYIALPEGERVEFGPLNSTGTPSRIPIPAQQLDHFSVCITQAEGDRPGLTEIESYHSKESETEWILPVDASDNLAADYWTDTDGTAEFRLYTYPAGSSLSMDDLQITMSGSSTCSLEVVSGTLVVHCPAGEAAVLKLSGDAQAGVCFCVSNPSVLTRTGIQLLQWADRHVSYAWEAVVYLADRVISRIGTFFE